MKLYEVYSMCYAERCIIEHSTGLKASTYPVGLPLFVPGRGHHIFRSLWSSEREAHKFHAMAGKCRQSCLVAIAASS